MLFLVDTVSLDMLDRFGSTMFLIVTFCLTVGSVNGVLWGFHKSKGLDESQLDLPPYPPVTLVSSPSPKATTEQIRQSGKVKVPLVLSDQKLIGRVTVGTPSGTQADQEFAMYITTSTWHVWLPSKALEENLNSNGKRTFRIFDKKQSDSYKSSQGEPYKETGPKYKVEGQFSNEKFKLGYMADKIVLTDLRFVEVDKIYTEFKGFDGVFGLALKSGEVGLFEKTPLGHLSKTNPIFGLYIFKSPATEIGFFVFGGSDEGLIDGEIKSHDIVQSDDAYVGWFFKVAKITLTSAGGAPVDVTFERGHNLAVNYAEADHIAIPAAKKDQVLEGILKGIQYETLSDNVITFQCGDHLTSLPDVAFVVDEHKYILKPEEYVVKENEKCTLSIKGHDGNTIMLGRTFMRKFYTRYDINKKTISFARSSEIY